MADEKTTLSALFTEPRGMVQGIEGTLLRRRRLSVLGLALGVLGATLQVVIAVIDRGYFKAVAGLKDTLGKVIDGTADRGVLIGLLGLVLLAFGVAVYALLRWTRVLQKDSEEPFRYTVSLDPFTRVTAAAPADLKLKGEERLALLHYDLRERLDARIGRFSLLDRKHAAAPDAVSAPAAAAGSTPASSASHIHISGEYALRKNRANRWYIYVMPTVRLGPEGSPVAMAYSVSYDLGETNSQTLEPARYEQIVERVYSSVATEVYRKIDTDVRVKIEWFPTRHLRAVALFHEAQDMARSNTVDAYDRALDLYSSSQRFFDLAFLGGWRRQLVRLPFGWQRHARYLQIRARVQIGYVRCQIYRQMIALQTGRKPNAIYEATWRMNGVIGDLLAVHARLICGDREQSTAKAQVMGYFTFQRDRFSRAFMRRPLEADFLRQRRILFDAYTVAALAHAVLANTRLARERLDEAVAIDPTLRERDPVHLVAEAEISPDLGLRVKLLREATDLAPFFQIAQYRLAQTADLLFRDENQLTPIRVDNVLRQYDEVLRINPGNIAAIASKGYLYWLTDQRRAAEQCFREGIEFKSIVRETSIAELTYGLARTLAERGDYNEAFDQYMQSVAVDPDVAAWIIGSHSRTQGRYYSRISEAMVERYAEYARRVKDALAAGSPPQGTPVDSVQRAVWSFVANDLANAHLNDYFRRGDPANLDAAWESLQAADAHSHNPVVHFNLATAYEWRRSIGSIGSALRSMDRAVKLSPAWQAARVAQITYTLSPWSLSALDDEIRKAEEERQRLDAMVRDAPPRLDAVAGDGPTPVTGSPAAATGRMVTPAEPPASTEAAAQLQRVYGELIDLRRQREDYLRNYNFNLRAALLDLTRNSRLRHLLEPGPPRAGPTQWTDNALALGSLAEMRWEQLDGSDVLALKSLANAATQSALKEHRDPSRTASEQTRAALEKCAALNRFLAQRFLHEDLDLCLWRLEVQEALNQKRDSEIEAVSYIVAFGVQEDPWHYWALSFWIGWLDVDRLAAVVERMVFSQSQDARRLGLALDELLRKIEGLPEEADDDSSERRNRGAEVACEAARSCVTQAPGRQRFHYDLGRALVLQQSWEDAVSAFDKAAGMAGVEVAPADLAAARARAYESHGDDLRRQGEPELAFNAYLQAALLDGRPSAYGKLPEACAELTTRARRIEAGSRVRQLFLGVLAGKELDESRRTALELLLAKLRIGESYGPRGFAREHVVTPISIEVAKNLIGLVATSASELQAEVRDEIGVMRDRLRAGMGVQVPGLRFLGNDGSFPNGSYLISLDETPLVSGIIEVAKRFYRGSLGWPMTERLRASPQTDPLTGRPGWWLPEREARDAGLASDLLVEPRSFMMRQVEAVLNDHLAHFLGHTELAEAMQERGLEAEQIAPGSTERNGLVSALRCLLLERVPIVDLPEIVTAWPEIRASQPHLRAQVEALRSLPPLRARLPGNDGEHLMFEIGPQMTSVLRDGLHDPGRAPLLNLSPNVYKAILKKVNGALSEDLRSAPALVIHDATLRPHLREVIKVKWPGVPVLALAELGERVLASPRTSIELE